MSKVIVKEVGDKLKVSHTAEKSKKKEHKKKSTNEAVEKHSATSCANSKRNLLELLACNDFEYFFTLTFPPKTAKEHSADELVKMVRERFADMREQVDGFENIKYVIVPEPHTDRRKEIHIHGAMLGVNEKGFGDFRNIKGRKTRYITARLKQGKKALYCPYLESYFGFNLFEPIENKDALGVYLSKFFKEAPYWKDATKRLFYASQGLNRPVEIAKGTLKSANSTDTLAALSQRHYKHRSADTGTCFGESFVIDNTFENEKFLIDMLA
ncbi:MAG: hypothetical protein RSD35_00790 [Oscillospiraceae bacterium]